MTPISMTPLMVTTPLRMRMIMMIMITTMITTDDSSMTFLMARTPLKS